MNKLRGISEPPPRADKSAPTDVRVIWLNYIIGGGRDKSAPTDVRVNLFIGINVGATLAVARHSRERPILYSLWERW
jgi:hypothetical protein